MCPAIDKTTQPPKWLSGGKGPQSGGEGPALWVIITGGTFSLVPVTKGTVDPRSNGGLQVLDIAASERASAVTEQGTWSGVRAVPA